MKTYKRGCIPQVLASQDSMGCQKCKRQESHSDQLFQEEVQFPMKQQRTGQNLKTTGEKVSIQCPEHQGLCRTAENLKLQPNECITSYDVKALFTSVPIESAIEIITKHLEDDKDLHIEHQ